MMSIINLEPREAFPANPTEGDLCVVGAGDNRHIYCRLNGKWVQLDTPDEKARSRESKRGY